MLKSFEKKSCILCNVKAERKQENVGVTILFSSSELFICNSCLSQGAPLAALCRHPGCEERVTLVGVDDTINTPSIGGKKKKIHCHSCGIDGGILCSNHLVTQCFCRDDLLDDDGKTYIGHYEEHKSEFDEEHALSYCLPCMKHHVCFCGKLHCSPAVSQCSFCHKVSHNDFETFVPPSSTNYYQDLQYSIRSEDLKKTKPCKATELYHLCCDCLQIRKDLLDTSTAKLIVEEKSTQVSATLKHQQPASAELKNSPVLTDWKKDQHTRSHITCDTVGESDCKLVYCPETVPVQCDACNNDEYHLTLVSVKNRCPECLPVAANLCHKCISIFSKAQTLMSTSSLVLTPVEETKDEKEKSEPSKQLEKVEKEKVTSLTNYLFSKLFQLWSCSCGEYRCKNHLTLKCNWCSKDSHSLAPVKVYYNCAECAAEDSHTTSLVCCNCKKDGETKGYRRVTGNKKNGFFKCELGCGRKICNYHRAKRNGSKRCLICSS